MQKIILISIMLFSVMTWADSFGDGPSSDLVLLNSVKDIQIPPSAVFYDNDGAFECKRGHSLRQITQNLGTCALVCGSDFTFTGDDHFTIKSLGDPQPPAQPPAQEQWHKVTPSIGTLGGPAGLGPMPFTTWVGTYTSTQIEGAKNGKPMQMNLVCVPNASADPKHPGDNIKDKKQALQVRNYCLKYQIISNTETPRETAVAPEPGTGQH